MNTTIHAHAISRRTWLLFLLLPLLYMHASPCHAKKSVSEDPSWQQSVKLLEGTCLSGEEIEYGKEILRGLDYNSQRIFRQMCRMDGLDFAKSKEAWAALLRYRFSYEQVLSFERWSEPSGIDINLAMKALPVIKTLSYEAGKAFRQFCLLPGATPARNLEIIPILAHFEDANIRAAQALLEIKGLGMADAVDGLAGINRLESHQAGTAKSLAQVKDMSWPTMKDSLPLLRKLRQEDAWNAMTLYRQSGMTSQDAWNWLISYFATPPAIQEEQFRRFDSRKKGALVQAFYDSGDEIIWKINNLHAVTDELGMEYSNASLTGMSAKGLQALFNRLSPQIRYTHAAQFTAAGSRVGQIGILRAATSADRVATGKNLTSANIYGLLSRGSELYDSSFRDILVPILHERIASRHNGNLLSFLQATDPANQLVSSFIVSLAQKGKLTTFFPEDSGEQQRILDLVAISAFQNEDSVILFSATFINLLEVLTPTARSFLINRMIGVADGGSASFARLITVILQYYQQEYGTLLTSQDRGAISRLLVKQGAVDLHRYQKTPFNEWKKDGLLGSISIFHPDDDGRDSFLSNARTLLGNGYQMRLSEQYSLDLDDPDQRRRAQAHVRQSAGGAPDAMRRLFSAMEHGHFVITFNKTVNGLTIRHASAVYGGREAQMMMMENFIKSGDEMFAQRGHSYWRSEQIIDPLNKLLENKLISEGDLQAKQRFLSLGSCGGVKVYTSLNHLFLGHVDILATIGTGLAMINDPYNRLFFEIVAGNPSSISWEVVSRQTISIFSGGRGRDYLQPGSLPAILHKILDEERKKKT